MPGALEGLRVVDLTTGLAGPLATMTLERPRCRRGEGRAARRRSRSGRTSGSVVTNRGQAQRRARPRRRRPIASVSSRWSTPPTCSSRASRPGTSPARGLDYATVVARPAVAGVLLAHRLPAHHRRRRPPRHRPAGAGALGHAVRAARLPRRPDLPARAAAEHRGVVPHGRGRSSPRCTSREVTGRGQWVETSLYQGVLSFTTQLWQDAEHRVEPWFEIGFEPRPSIYECADGLWVHSMHFAGGRGKDRSIVWEILGIDPPDLEWNPTGASGVRRPGPRRDRADEAPGPARPVLGQRDRDRAGAARARGARGRAGDQQRHVGRGRRPGARSGAAGRHLVPGARARRRRGAGSATRDRAAHRRGARRARERAGTRTRRAAREATGVAHARGHQDPRPRQLPRRSVRPDAARRPRRDRLQAGVAPGRPDATGHAAVQRVPARQARRRRRPQATRGRRDRAPPHARGRRRAPQHAAGRRRAAGRRLRDRQAAQPDRDLLPHDHVGQRRAARHLARLRPARAVVVRARAGARRRGQRTQLVPLRHVRPGVRGAVGARGADGAVLARAHRRGSAGRHVDRERRRAPQHRRVDRARRLVGAAAHRPAADRPRSALPAVPDERRLARAGVPRARRTGPRWRRWCPASTTALRDAAARCERRRTLRVLRSSRRAPRSDAFDAARRRRRAGGDRRPRTRGARGSTQPDLVAAGLVADYEHPTYGRFRQFGHLVAPVGDARRASPDRRRCSASTRARCSPSSATPARRSTSCASAASPSGPTDAARHPAGRKR